MNKRVKKYLSQSPWKIGSDVFFWALIILLIIPSTRSVFLGTFSKVRTILFSPKIKASDGPVLSASDYNWVLSDKDGNNTTLAAFKGHVLLINTWATWCPPCRAEMPSIEKLHRYMKDNKGELKILAVSNEEASVINEYIRSKGYTFPVYRARSQTPGMMQSRSIPATFIFNKEGRLVYQKNGAFDWNSKKVRDFLDQLLAE